MAYSEELKRPALDHVAAGSNKRETARVFSLAPATVYVWLAHSPDHQRGKPGPKAGHKIDRDKFAQIVVRAD
jgi:transposase